MTQMQKAYETIRAHLIKQGRPAKDPMTRSCFYRTEGGLKCAVGCLIDDAVYDETLEDATPLNQSVQQALKASGWVFTFDGYQFLRELQESHDDWDINSDDGLEFVIRKIDEAARVYGLEVVK
jgi:hypothetical protein